MRERKGHTTHRRSPHHKRRSPSLVVDLGRVRHLFHSWPEVARVVSSARNLALFLDFDGTLVPLRRRPSDVKPLGRPMRKILRRLAANQRIKVCVISGRPLGEVQCLVQVPEVQSLGLHGWDGCELPRLQVEQRLLRIAKQQLDQGLAVLRPIWIEDKGLGLAVHYRGAPSRTIQRARARVGEVLKTVAPRIRLLRGHKVWELLPRQIDGKCPAIKALLSTLPRPTLPIIIGDDIADESAFRAFPKGLTIHVGPSRRTAAHFRLRNPAEVEMFLLKLEAIVAQEPPSARFNLSPPPT